MKVTLKTVELSPSRGHRPDEEGKLIYKLALEIYDDGNDGMGASNRLSVDMVVDTFEGLGSVMDLAKEQLVAFAGRLRAAAQTGNLGHDVGPKR